MVSDPVRIRSALPDEAALLTRLALSSKAHWGYDEGFLEACRDELTVGHDDIERHTVAVLEDRGVVRGFYMLRCGDGVAGSEAPQRGVLEYLYVDPATIGFGHGRRLWLHMVASAREWGYKQIVIHSDPHAEGFYRALGARRVGEVASGSIEGRQLPLMNFDMSAEGGNA